MTVAGHVQLTLAQVQGLRKELATLAARFATSGLSPGYHDPDRPLVEALLGLLPELDRLTAQAAQPTTSPVTQSRPGRQPNRKEVNDR